MENTLQLLQGRSENRLHIIAEVSDSSSLPPTTSAVLPEDLPLRELLKTLLGPEGKRRLRMKYLTNQEFFKLYDSDLVLRLHKAKN